MVLRGRILEKTRVPRTTAEMSVVLVETTILVDPSLADGNPMLTFLIDGGLFIPFLRSFE